MCSPLFGVNGGYEVQDVTAKVLIVITLTVVEI